MKNATDSNAPDSPDQSPTRRALIIGEVLFDCFPSGHKVLGGAPFNVAWNLSGLGLRPVLISAVGDDALGAEVVDEMRSWEMDLDGIEVLAGIPTGQVTVKNAGTEPEYHFQEDCAWDHIRLPGAEFAPDRCALLYHGSLAARGKVTREAVLKLRAEPELPVFVDLNLRPPFYEKEALPELVEGAHWLKLNADELRLMSELFGVSGDDLPSRGAALADKLAIPHLLLTDGPRGAYWLRPGHEPAFAASPKVEKFLDSVGAGDAFAAVSIFGIMHRWEPETILRRAVAFAARVCELQGATTKTPEFYQDEFKQWK